MKRLVSSVLVFPLLFMVAADIYSFPQLPKQRTPKIIPPQISSVSQEYPWLAVNLIVVGKFIPSKEHGNIRHLIRLASLESSDVHYAGGNRMWTSTRIEDYLSFNIPAGVRYKVGIVRYDISNPGVYTLVSNELEYLLLINLNEMTPSPVPLGTQELRIATANLLNPPAGHGVKLGQLQAPIIQWGGPSPEGGVIRIRTPSGLFVPSYHDLVIEKNGVVVSNTLRVRFLGPVIKPPQSSTAAWE